MLIHSIYVCLRVNPYVMSFSHRKREIYNECNINGTEMRTSLSDCGDLLCYDIHYIFERKNGMHSGFWVQRCLEPHREEDIERLGLKIKDLLKRKIVV